ncbi:MAG: hypothetical protein ACRCWQ_02040 [Bacilli bacterium]
MNSYYETNMGCGRIEFVYLNEIQCKVTESDDPMMPVGTVFPKRDLDKLKCEVNVA